MRYLYTIFRTVTDTILDHIFWSYHEYSHSLNPYFQLETYIYVACSHHVVNLILAFIIQVEGEWNDGSNYVQMNDMDSVVYPLNYYFPLVAGGCRRLDNITVHMLTSTFSEGACLQATHLIVALILGSYAMPWPVLNRISIPRSPVEISFWALHFVGIT